MAKRKRGRAKRTVSKKSKNVTGPVRLGSKIALAWKNLILFLVIFIFSYLFYRFSSTDLLKNFFGILSIIFGFLTFAFIITFIVLLILKKARK